MLARIRKAMEDKDQGFTLIELLVVIIIIGILAAIAIPIFLNQRKKAVDSSMQADLRNVATAVETAFVSTQSYPTSVSTTGNTVTVTPTSGTATTQTISTGNVVGSYVVNTSNDAFCMVASRATGAQPGSNDWVYISNAGGLQAASVTTCPAAGAF